MRNMSDQKKITPVNEQLDNTLVVESDAGAASLASEKRENLLKEKELNGPKGLEPTRYGDWESKGRCYDF